MSSKESLYGILYSHWKNESNSDGWISLPPDAFAKLAGYLLALDGRVRSMEESIEKSLMEAELENACGLFFGIARLRMAKAESRTAVGITDEEQKTYDALRAKPEAGLPELSV